MNIRNKYNLLSSEERDLNLINKIKVLKDQCIIEQNKEYYYLSNLLTVDIYIDNELYR